MEMVVFWALVAIVALAVVYVCALKLRARKAALGRDPARSDATSQTKEHGVDLQARRKSYDDVT
jgi:flagellar biosynthesis/type III secretory pathway M-ring protein FliF/YscJ